MDYSRIDIFEFENNENISPIFYQLDGEKSTARLKTCRSKMTGGLVEVFKDFHRPISNLPLRASDRNIIRNEIF
jgi:hypothetical protein